jgi:hypothetical protein
MNKDEKLLNDLQKRVERLEKVVFPTEGESRTFDVVKKVKSLPELVRMYPLQNGQQRIAAIVGYMEKIEKRGNIKLADIKRGWGLGKFDGSFANVLVMRAVRDGLIADYNNDSTYVLTQSGESFWEQLNNFEGV